jgi:hypothetical protein
MYIHTLSADVEGKAQSVEQSFQSLFKVIISTGHRFLNDRKPTIFRSYVAIYLVGNLKCLPRNEV